jgi:hypothetical protein
MAGRTARRTGLLGALVALAVGVMPGIAAAAPRATGVIDGSGTSYTLTITNTGEETIRCFRFTSAEGVRITSVSPPAQLSPPQFAPPNRSQFGAQTDIPRGSDLIIQFTTEAPYPENGGGVLDVSSTCEAGSDVSFTVTGPVFACRCIGLTAELTKFSFGTPRELDFKVKWTLGCSEGTGQTCRGRIRFETLQAGHKFIRKSEQTVECVGACAGRTTRTVPPDGRKDGRTVRTGLDTLLPKGFERDKRAGKSVKIRAKLYCLDAAGRERLFKTLTFRVQFRRGGFVDGRNSDLNGDKRRDRPRRR